MRRLLVALLLSTTVGASTASMAQDLDRPMTFTVVAPCSGTACRAYVLAEGTFVESTPRDFATFLGSLDFRPRVCFHSAGGNLAAGLELGHLIRRERLDTCLAGPYMSMGYNLNDPDVTLVAHPICLSACAYAFLGGVVRSLGDEADFGVHQFRGAVRDSGEVAAQITTTVLGMYLDEMGVDRALLDIASITGSTNIQVITRAQALQMRVDNSTPQLSKWRLQSNEIGKVVLITDQVVDPAGAKLYATFFQANGELRLFVIYQPVPTVSVDYMQELLSSHPQDLIIEAAGQKFVLTSVKPWKAIENGSFTTIASVPRELPPILFEVTSFHLEPNAWWAHSVWELMPEGTFGTEGLANGLRAVMRTHDSLSP